MNAWVRSFAVAAGIAAAFATACAASDIPAGIVVSTEGVCDIARPGEPLRLIREKETFYLGDRIRTKSYSKAELRLEDGSVLKLAPGSSLSVEDLTMSSADKRESCLVKLTRGKVEAVVAKTGAPDTFVVETPNARNSVKGSDIFVSFLAGKTGVFVAEGAVAVSNPAAAMEKIKLLPGECVYVPFQDPPGEIRPVRDTEISRHRKDVTPELIKKWIPEADASMMEASVIAVSGTARVNFRDTEDWQELHEKDILSEGDRLQTGEDGVVEVRMANGNVIRVQANTELVIETLRQAQEASEYSNSFSVAYGRVTAVVERLNKRSTFQVKTPTVVCGVRGTILDVVVPPPALASQVPTQVFFEGGSGVVTNTMTGQMQQVAAGQFVNVDVGGMISAPVVNEPGQSGAPGSGAGGTAPTGPKPLQPAGTLMKPGSGAPPLGSDQALLPVLPPDVLDPTMVKIETILPVITPTIPFDEVVRIPPPESVLYHHELYAESRSGLVTQPGTSHLYINNDGTWVANIINGVFNGNFGTWSFTQSNSLGDTLIIYGTDFPAGGTWTGTVQTGSVAGGPDPDKLLTGTITEGIKDEGTSGGFAGRAEGTWTDAVGFIGS